MKVNYSIFRRGLVILLVLGCLMGASFLKSASPSSGQDVRASGKNPFVGFTKKVWGMSKKAVKRVAEGKLVNETEGYLEYQTKIWELNCTIAYFLKEARLYEVVYRINSKLGKSAKYPVADFDRCFAILKKNYGAPGSYYVYDGLPNIQWEIAGLQTEIELYIIPSLPSQINVCFKYKNQFELKPSPEAQDLTRTADPAVI